MSIIEDSKVHSKASYGDLQAFGWDGSVNRKYSTEAKTAAICEISVIIRESALNVGTPDKRDRRHDLGGLRRS